MRRAGERGLALDARDHLVRALARGAIRTVRHGYEARRERRQTLHGFPQRGFHVRIAGREELEGNTDRHVCTHFVVIFATSCSSRRSGLLRLRGRRGDGGEHVLAVRFNGAQALAGESRVREQAAHARDRMLDDAFARRLERFVALEQPQLSA